MVSLTALTLTENRNVRASSEPDLADAPRGRVSGRRRGGRLHGGRVILGAAELRHAAPPVEGLPFQQGFQAAAIHRP